MLATGFLAFVLIGVVQALYGPAFPVFQQRYRVGVSAVGMVVSFHFFGSMMTILASRVLLPRFGYRRVLTAAAVLLACGSLGVAVSPLWAGVLLASLLIGLGFGLFDVGMNLLFARSFGSSGAPALNLLNAMFGLGAVLGPVVVAAMPSTFWPFAITALLALVVALLCARLEAPEPLKAPLSQGEGVSFAPALGFALLAFLYVASEVGVASWETSHLTPTFGEGRAAAFTSLYWAALTVGRLLVAPLSGRLAPGLLVFSASSLALLAALMTHGVAVAPYAYTLLGLAFAPIFPTALAWLQASFPERVERLAPWVMAAANFGAVLASPLIGAMVALSSGASIPTSISALILGMLVVTAALWRHTRSP